MFNNTFNTFYFQLYGVSYISARKPASTTSWHGLLFPVTARHLIYLCNNLFYLCIYVFNNALYICFINGYIGVRDIYGYFPISIQ